jgi:hypothetical protein
MLVPAALVAVMLYKVDFDVRDGIEGKDHASMHYSMLVDESQKGVFQAVSRVLFDPGSLASGACTVWPPYIDAAVSIELSIHSSDGRIRLEGTIELSGITGVVFLGSLCEPIVAQRKVVFNTVMELETPTLVLDDQSTSTPKAPHKIEIVVRRIN